MATNEKILKFNVPTDAEKERSSARLEAYAAKYAEIVRKTENDNNKK